MSRELQRRAEWEARIPFDWAEIPVSDAHRFINRGRPRELISRMSLYRLAHSGAMGAMGGPGTGVQYRFRRADLIEYMVRLEVALSDREDRPRRKARRSEDDVSVADPAVLPRSRRRRTNARRVGVRMQQTNMFGDEEG